MSYIKNSIPDDYNCGHFMNVDECIDCQYAMQTAHLPEKYRPSMEKWYNKSVKKNQKKHQKKK
tara:strand:- start:1791 stop:1979 length:189 start_codon:yes stop_codon:yes gene_type:complete